MTLFFNPVSEPRAEMQLPTGAHTGVWMPLAMGCTWSSKYKYRFRSNFACSWNFDKTSICPLGQNHCRFTLGFPAHPNTVIFFSPVWFLFVKRTQKWFDELCVMAFCADGGSHGRKSWYPTADLSYPSLLEQLHPAITRFCHCLLSAMFCGHTAQLSVCSIPAFPGDLPGLMAGAALCCAGAECREQAGQALWHVLQLWEAVARYPDPGGWDQRPGGISLIALARLLQLFELRVQQTAICCLIHWF